MISSQWTTMKMILIWITEPHTPTYPWPKILEKIAKRTFAGILWNHWSKHSFPLKFSVNSFYISWWDTMIPDGMCQDQEFNLKTCLSTIFDLFSMCTIFYHETSQRPPGKELWGWDHYLKAWDTGNKSSRFYVIKIWFVGSLSLHK